MNLSAVVQEAIKHNENVPTAEENLNEAEETVKQGYGGISPTINANQQLFWQQTPPVTTSGFSPGYQPQTWISASQPLLQGFREYNGISKVKRLRNSAQFNKENTELAIYRQVVAGYYNILSLERDIENVKEKSTYLKDRIKDLNHMHAIGRSQLTDVLTAKSTAAANDVSEEQDRINLATARDQFALVTGLAPNIPLDDDTGGFTPSIGTLDSYLSRIKNRPDVKAAKETADANNYGVDIAKADHLPSLALTGDYYLDRPTNFNGVDWDAKLVITLPLFAGGVTQSKVRQAKSEAHKSDLAFSLAERTADQDIRGLYDAVASDLRQKQLTEESVRLSEMTFKEEQRSYKFGLVNNLDVLSALANFIDAKRTYDSNRFNLKRDFLTLKAASIIQ
jgi:outer membrane protein